MAQYKYIKAIYAALGDLGAKESKESLVHQYTNGRTTSTRAMTDKEALELVADLSAQTKSDREELQDKSSKMIRAIYSIAYDLNITHIIDGKVKVDTKRLYALIERLSPQKKGLQAHNHKELTILLSIVKKYYQQQINKK